MRSPISEGFFFFFSSSTTLAHVLFPFSTCPSTASLHIRGKAVVKPPKIGRYIVIHTQVVGVNPRLRSSYLFEGLLVPRNAVYTTDVPTTNGLRLVVRYIICTTGPSGMVYRDSGSAEPGKGEGERCASPQLSRRYKTFMWCMYVCMYVALLCLAGDGIASDSVSEWDASRPLWIS
ncbi:hypothetical protein GGS21DRAFT_305380 [Xylaria nigripes]|nr:hypothetical protein GGS21DRAFT_305380 [Xylaria nigripes]